MDRPNVYTYITISALALLIFLIVSNTGGAASPSKILFLLPIIINAGQHGRFFGLGLTAFISGVLVYIDLTGVEGVRINQALEGDLVLISIMFLCGWLFGGLADVEKDIRKELSILASCDELTGLFNHRAFQERLELELQAAHAAVGSLGLVMLDIDYFKYYNDTFGHQYGDDVLIQMGRIIGERLPESAVAARYGGDEFAIILRGATEAEVLELAENIKSGIEDYSFYGGNVLPKRRISISAGVALFPTHASTKEELIRLADHALYRAKNLNRDKVEVYFSVLDELGRMVSESERGDLTSLKNLVRIINAKDRYTFGHSERTVIYAVAVAKRLGWRHEEIDVLKYGAFLHDIGKIEIDPSILNKTSSLTETEYTIIKQHPVWGSEMVLPIQSLNPGYCIIRGHHENYDGTGYPDGIKGTEIPEGARILRIVDSFDAMTSHRTYRDALSREAALEELTRGIGTSYDPELVPIFIQLAEKNRWGRN
ncbi:MAG: diguanylate cyclase [Firmicutes bacterium]|nr:diguanylate cyclase [Bacillota bacterium]